MKIWGRINSSNVRKVLWCAEELGLAYEHINAGGAFGLVNEPEYRAMNPNGLIPCLQDGDLIVWESNAIVRYLARQYGQEPFTPVSPADWAQADQWMDWASLSFAGPLRDLVWNMLRCPPEQRSDAEIQRGEKECARLMQLANTALQHQAFLSGKHLGVGDIPLGCIAYAWFSLPVERPALEHLSRWYASLCERPAYQKAVMTAMT
ncbi:glutathione S-transferase family protein [Lampropedia aestuarii]|uniref:Glutathione S-transferase family protein n=1 Tax=Lampropedia aestuarii TaxID=2562762 RepID=A0A4S5BHP3_9BURK|nr:glutathione S-transferase family protein [Lampropedia aestuarii]MDH5857250.1 glutathione S-transferase family protein [Lampropedia aestuarii]THJ31904.1 glutathione S-transferase family protein [Lampropedia aestuarii]